jgi:hypothetical protein
MILEIPDERDLEILLPLLERLGVSITNLENAEGSMNEATRAHHYQIIDRGIKVEDPEQFIRGYEQNREDRPLPGRD